jgi:hypothetical protein
MTSSCRQNPGRDSHPCCCPALSAMIKLAPIPPALTITLTDEARLFNTFENLREALGDPHWRDDPDFPAGFDPELSRCAWRVCDRRSGATMAIWDEESPTRTPAETTSWIVAWSDGPGRPGSGRLLVDETVGTRAGGRVRPIV